MITTGADLFLKNETQEVIAVPTYYTMCSTIMSTNFELIFLSLFLAYGANAAPNILQGPSTRTTVVGPDGSKIEAYAPGGRINLEEHGTLIQEAPTAVLHAAKEVEAPEVTNVVASEVAVPQVAGEAVQFPRVWPGGIEVKVVTEEPTVVKVPAVVGQTELVDEVVETV